MSSEIACEAIVAIAAKPTARDQTSGHSNEFATRYSRYGWGMDVRSTYSHLPCQPFWTWLTGKYPTQREQRRTPLFREAGRIRGRRVNEFCDLMEHELLSKNQVDIQSAVNTHQRERNEL